MADRIGAFRNIVPVISRANLPPKKTPVPEPEPPGVRWSQTSKFKYTLPLYDVDPHNAPTSKKGMTVKDRTEHVYETRVESLANAVMWKTQDYDISKRIIEEGLGATDSTILSETWTDLWILLGTESVQEIIGYTRSSSGRVTERYRTVEIERYIHFALTKRPSTPAKGDATHKYGELP